MKNIRILSIFVLVLLLSLPLDVLACDKTALDAAKTAHDTAKKELDDLKDINFLNTLQNLLKSLGYDKDLTDGDLGQDVWDLLPEGASALDRRENIRTAEQKLASAESALTEAQASYDLCVVGEELKKYLAECGHATLHEKQSMGACGHEDYFCQAMNHGGMQCPRNPLGERCITQDGFYDLCRPEHDHKPQRRVVVDI